MHSYGVECETMGSNGGASFKHGALLPFLRTVVLRHLGRNSVSVEKGETIIIKFSTTTTL
jgi:hypothetical protein